MAAGFNQRNVLRRTLVMPAQAGIQLLVAQTKVGFPLSRE
jgi:hypothetical protein